MGVVLGIVIGLPIGACVVFLLMLEQQRALKRAKADHNTRIERLREAQREHADRVSAAEAREAELESARRAFDERVIRYDELAAENVVLKRDLQNVDITMRKMRLDVTLQHKRQDEIVARTEDMGGRYLKENVKWIGKSLTPNNYAACKKRLVDVIQRCRGIGFEVSADEEAAYIADLKAEFEKAVRAALEREEQARIRAQIRDEQQREREIARELKRLEDERAAIEAALARALADAREQHSDEVDRLRERLAEAEARAQRAVSMAQLTRAGHVYVISNIGSFGDGVFKVGMTRRLEPLDRVRELGNASVPFPYDVHMMISCDDAPKLENALHRELHKSRLNRVNLRREFFRVDLETLRELVERNHGTVEYVADAEALEYRQSIDMSEEDAEYIEQVYDVLDDEEEAAMLED